MAEKWYQNSFRRCLVDMHIADWDDSFFSAFSSKKYIEMMQLADVDTAYIYANSCTGICNWPTKTGHMHNGLKGKDIVRELTEGLASKGINVIVYINIWSKWAYDNHPDWRAVSQDGRGTLEFQWGKPGRYGVCCFNSPYRDYVVKLVRELCQDYQFTGLWVDMILWRIMCYCNHCRRRFFDETGYELPDFVNWEDSVWLLYLRKREEWNEQFFERIIDTAKSYNPDLTVMCNSSYYPDYFMGLSLKYFRLGEFIGGDYNMDRLGHSFECKFYNSVSKNKPFEFLGSVMDPNLNEHSIIKTKDRIKTLMFSALANNGRYGFIDAINPDGTLNRLVYQRMKDIFTLEKRYEKYLRNDVVFCQDVGIYTNLESMINPQNNGKRVMDAPTSAPHMTSTKLATLSLIENHIPFGILTKYDLDNLKNHKIIIMSDLFVLDDLEIEKFTEYVRDGGCLYVSGRTGLYDPDGMKYPEGRLAEILGVRYLGETSEELTYLVPCDSAFGLLQDYTKANPLTVETSQTICEACFGTVPLATLTLPYIDPGDKTKFASATSNPPGRHTNYPAVVYHTFGSGQVIYSASRIESMRKDDQISTFINLLDFFKARPYSFEVNAPRCIEVTMYKQPQEHRYMIHLLNVQKELPNIPVFDTCLCISIDEKPRRIMALPDEDEISFEYENGLIHFTDAKIDIFNMYSLEYD